MLLIKFLALLNVLRGSESGPSTDIERKRNPVKSFLCEGNYRKLIFYPFVFRNGLVIASPSTRYDEIKETEKEYVEDVIMGFCSLIFDCMGPVAISPYKKWVYSEIAKEVLIESDKTRYFNSIDIYKKKKEKSKGVTLGFILKKITWENIHLLNEFGNRLIDKVETETKKLNKDPSSSEEEKEKEKKKLEIVKKYAKLILTKEQQNLMISAFNIVHDACVYLWEKKENREHFILKMRLNRLYSDKIEFSLGDGPMKKREGSDIVLLGYLSHDSLIYVYNKYGIEVAAELVKEVFLEHKDDSEFCADRIIEREEKRRRIEEIERKAESERYSEELIREEEEEKRRSRGKESGFGLVLVSSERDLCSTVGMEDFLGFDVAVARGLLMRDLRDF
ncbi:uncharacterized protein Eint_040030 [Encephalitozoon intestinalis ATCC 50506]|uniref:Uncharacterized protein n=1 Tax=Encephalitozoon intestinalis (strain ATCC 50506) TaxID=876142 RepID=E0S6G1_ENCIT|nr:uncharacterized protein Eint_040030 [Encephalitozoon intestinalis ATCC 50506]ADM11296.1 hypothetical protein Eint_040030 [Encephalitozoon intestinalis ATCC 50506]